MQKFLSSLSSGQRKVFYFFLVLGIALLFERMYVNPIMKKIAQTEKEISEQEEEIKNDLGYLANKEQITKKSESYAKYIPQNLNSKDDINSEFYSTLEKLSAESNISAKINLDEIIDEDTHFKYYAKLDCSGALSDMVSFMHILNSTTDLFKVVEFTISPKRGVEDQVSTSMRVVKLILKPNS